MKAPARGSGPDTGGLGQQPMPSGSTRAPRQSSTRTCGARLRPLGMAERRRREIVRGKDAMGKGARLHATRAFVSAEADHTLSGAPIRARSTCRRFSFAEASASRADISRSRRLIGVVRSSTAERIAPGAASARSSSRRSGSKQPAGSWSANPWRDRRDHGGSLRHRAGPRQTFLPPIHSRHAILPCAREQNRAKRGAPG